MCLGFRYHLFLAFRLIIHSRILQYHFWFPMRVFLLLFFVYFGLLQPSRPSKLGVRLEGGLRGTDLVQVHYPQLPDTQVWAIDTHFGQHFIRFALLSILCVPKRARFQKKNFMARPTFELHFTKFHCICFPCVICLPRCRTKDGLCCVVSVTHCVNFSILCALAPHEFSCKGSLTSRHLKIGSTRHHTDCHPNVTNSS
jgi:hypothetical protein